MSRCLNTVPGFQCYECPEGYVGTYEDAYAWEFHQRVFEYGNLNYSIHANQTCNDIDECAINNGGCDPMMPCINTPVSFGLDFKFCLFFFSSFSFLSCLNLAILTKFGLSSDFAFLE